MKDKMVCPCVLPILATTSAGGAFFARKNRHWMWIFIIVALVLMIYFYFWYQRKKQNCTVCKKNR